MEDNINNVRKNVLAGDKKISTALMASFVILTIQYFILIYYSILGTNLASQIQIITKILVGIAFLYALPDVLKRNIVKLIIVYFTAIFIFTLHYLLFPENRIFIKDQVFPVFFMSLPAFIYSLSIKDFDILKKAMVKSSKIIFIVGGLLGVLVFLRRVSIGTYSMTLSYYLLLPTVIFIDALFDKISIKYLLPASVSIIIILALGARGPIMCIVVFFVLKVIKSDVKLNSKKFVLYFGLSNVLIISYLMIDKILIFLNNNLLKIGIKSRSIQLFLRDEIHLSGREQIYSLILKAIYEKPILGIGIAGDRRIMGNGYTHNILLEIIGNFGIIIGSILIILLIFLIVRSLLSKEKKYTNLIIIWLSLGFFHLMVSGSYLTDIKFWILLGLLFNKSRDLNYNNKQRLRINSFEDGIKPIEVILKEGHL